MNRNAVVRYTLIFCLLFLTACSSLMPKTDQQQWRIEGKIGVTTPDESLTGFLVWEQRADNYLINVSGPLGQGSTQIQGNSQQITLVQGKEKVHSTNPEQLIYKQMGWNFPINNLKYWIIGKAAPYSESTSQYDDDRLSELLQDNWKVEYFRYDNYSGLPSRLRISQGNWKFTLIIKRWSSAG